MLSKLLKEVAYKNNDQAQAALSEIYNQFGAKIASAAFKVLKDKQLSEEVLNDVMVKIWENAKQYCQLTNPLAYITTIAYNRALDIIRLTKEYPNDNIVRLVDCHKSSINHYDLANTIENALAKLEEIPRTIIILKAVYEYSFLEIAKITKIKYHDVRRIYEKTIIFLQGLLKDIN